MTRPPAKKRSRPIPDSPRQSPKTKALCWELVKAERAVVVASCAFVKATCAALSEPWSAPRVVTVWEGAQGQKLRVAVARLEKARKALK